MVFGHFSFPSFIPFRNATHSAAEMHVDLFQLLTERFSVELINSKKEDLKAYFHSHRSDIKKLNQLLIQLIKQSIDHQCCERVFPLLAEALDLEQLVQLAQAKAQEEGLFFKPAIELAQIGVNIYPPQLDISIADKVRTGLKRYRPMALYFIPNIINIFLGAFNFLDFQKKSTSLWEKTLLLEIVYKFFLIPFALIQILTPILLVPAKVYCATALIIIGIGSFVAAYQKWLKPFPDEIIKCENLNKKFQCGLIEPKVGRASEVNQLVSALLTGSNVLLVGKSGDGKTSLVHRYLQLKQEGKLSKSIQDLHDFEMDCGALIGDGTFGFADVLDQVKGSIPSDQARQALMFFDKVEQITNTEPCFLAFSKRFLEDQPSPIAIAATTYEGLKKIEAMDKDGSFMRRFPFQIKIEPASDDQNRAMLRAYIHQKANDVPITDEAIDKIVACAKDKEYRPLLGTPGKALAIMDNLIGRCRALYSSNRDPQELAAAKEAFEFFQMRIVAPLSTKDAETYEKLKIRRDTAEQKWKGQKVKIKKIQELIHQQLRFKNTYFKLTHEIAKTNPQHVSQKTQKLYLTHHFYGLKMFEEMIAAQVNPLANEMDVQINANMVETVFRELKRNLNAGLSIDGNSTS